MMHYDLRFLVVYKVSCKLLYCLVSVLSQFTKKFFEKILHVLYSSQKIFL